MWLARGTRSASSLGQVRDARRGDARRDRPVPRDQFSSREHLYPGYLGFSASPSLNPACSCPGVLGHLSLLRRHRRETRLGDAAKNQIRRSEAAALLTAQPETVGWPLLVASRRNSKKKKQRKKKKKEKSAGHLQLYWPRPVDRREEGTLQYPRGSPIACRSYYLLVTHRRRARARRRDTRRDRALGAAHTSARSACRMRAMKPRPLRQHAVVGFHAPTTRSRLPAPPSRRGVDLSPTVLSMSATPREPRRRHGIRIDLAGD